MKLIIAGSRTFNDWELVKRSVTYLLSKTDATVEIVSGRCSSGVHTFTTNEGIMVYGADGLGERFANKSGLKVKPFPADWSKYGLAAGPIRNEEMAKYATHCICFWDGESKGTKSMIDLANKNGLTLKVIKYNKCVAV